MRTVEALMSPVIRGLLVFVLLLGPAYAKNGGSSGPRSPVSVTSSSVKSAKTITTSTKKSTGKLSKSDKSKLEQTKIDQQKKDAQQKSDTSNSGMIQDISNDYNREEGNIEMQYNK